MGRQDTDRTDTMHGSRTVLIIEPDVALQTLFIELLAAAGYEVVTALHSDDLRQIVHTSNPVVGLIAGGRRGGFTAGWQTAAALKAISRDLPLIMVTTNYAAVDEVGRTRRGGLFVAAIRKPFAIDDLIATLTRVSAAEHDDGTRRRLVSRDGDL
jgi:DNA-binding NtrC family response regulator